MTRCACSETHDPTFDSGPLKLALKRHTRTPDALIPVLQEVQREYGYLPADALRMSASELGLPLSVVFGVATFYDQFHLHQRGRHILRVCTGVACHVKGAEMVAAALASQLGTANWSTSDDLMFTIEPVACVGLCGLAPVVMVGDEAYGSLSGRDARKLGRKVKSKAHSQCP